MAQPRDYREDLQRDWTVRPLQPGTPTQQNLIDRFANYLMLNGVVGSAEAAQKHAKELWRIVRLT